MDIETVRAQMTELKLVTAANEISEVLVKYKKAVSLNWISELLERELDARQERRLQERIKRASFPEITSLEKFNWDFNPKIPREKIENLASLDFIKNSEIALFLGPPGTGKTHVALAIGIKAATQGYRVYCTSCKKLSQNIKIAIASNTLDLLFKKMLSANLWIIDDWGVVSLQRETAEEIFDLLDRRKQNSAMILTSNRDVSEWGAVFPDPVIANAALDRMFDRADITIFEGDSYRLKGRILFPELDIKKIKV